MNEQASGTGHRPPMPDPQSPIPAGTPPDPNPLTDAERQRLQAAHRGRQLDGGLFRNFCAECGLAIAVPHRRRLREDLLCVECEEGGA